VPGAKFDIKGTTMRLGTAALNTNQVLTYQGNYTSFSTGYYDGSGASGYIIGQGYDLSTPYVFVKNGGNVGIGTTSPGAKLDITGTANQNQLILRAYSTQSNSIPIIKVTNSSGAELFRIHSDSGSNLFIGGSAGNANTVTGTGNEGLYNTFIGGGAGARNTTGQYNTAVGNSALDYNTIGGSNNAFGMFTLFRNTTGGANTAMGHYALTTNTTDNYNTAFGWQSLYTNTIGSYNTAIGASTLQNLKTSGSISSFADAGSGVITVTTSDSHSQVVGMSVVISGTTNYNGTYVIASVPSTTTFTITATYVSNDATGTWTSSGSNLALNNVALGRYAGYSSITGSNNTFLGYQSGYSNQTGTGNIFIGYQAGFNDTGSNKLYIANSSTTSPLIFGNFSTGNVGIGTTLPTAPLFVLAASGGITTQNNNSSLYGTVNSMNDAGYLTALQTMGSASAGSSGTNIGRLYTNAPNGLHLMSNTGSMYFGFSGSALAASSMVLTGGGNLGIGTTSPQTALDVTGSITLTGSSNKVITTNGTGYISINALHKLTFNNANYIVENSPVDYSMAFFTGSTPTSNLVIRETGNVGIGTTNPNVALDVIGNIRVPDGYSIQFAGTGDRIYGGNSTAYGLIFQTGAATSMRIDRTGNVGIGTTSPGRALDVSGSINYTGSLYSNGVMLLTSDGTSNYLKIGAKLYIQYGSTTLGVIDNSGNVGIGTTSPQQKLEVVGDALVTYSGSVASRIHTDSSGYLSLDPSGNAGYFYDGSNAFNFGLYNANTLALNLSANGNSYFNGGNVGIGTTSPTTKFDIASSGNSVLRVGTTNNTSSYVSALVLANGDGTTVTNSVASLGVMGNETNLRFMVASNAGATATNFASYTRMLINSNGNVGIGTTAPNYKLDVNGGFVRLQGASLYVQDSTPTFTTILTQTSTLSKLYNNAAKDFSIGTNSSASQLYLQSGGSVGIGTSTPSTTFNVNGSVLFSGSTNASPVDGEFVYDTTGHYYKYYSSSDSAWHSLASGNITVSGGYWTQNGTILSYTAGNVGIGTTSPGYSLDVTGSVRSGQYLMVGVNGVNIDGTGGMYKGGGSVLRGSYYFDSATSGGAIPLRLSSGDSSTYSGGYVGFNTDGVERLRITSAGNVGIGTTSPQDKLDIVGGNLLIRSTNGTVTQQNGIKFYDGAGSGYYGSAIMDEVGGAFANSLVFMTATTASNVTEKMRITAAGNVGIGTSSPGYALTLGSGALSVPLGSSSATSINFGGNASTGIYSAATGYVALVGGGVAVAGVDNSARFVLYNGKPLNFDASAGGGDVTVSRLAAGILQIGTGNTANALGTLTVANIGIGTTAPAKPLEISTTVSLPARLTSSSAYGSGLSLDSTGTDGDEWQMISSGSSSLMGGGHLFFYNADTSNYAMTMLNSGNVGIGTTSPSAKLDTMGGLVISKAIYASPSGHSGAIEMSFRPTDIGYIASYDRTNSVYRDLVVNANNLSLFNGSGSGIYVNSSGNVGIGTTSPTALLDVSGTMHATKVTLGTSGAFLQQSGNWASMYYGNGVSLEYYNGSSVVDGLVLNSSGNVGIGTTSPAKKFQLGGDYPTARFSYYTTGYPDDYYADISHNGANAGISSLGGLQIVSQSAASNSGTNIVFGQKIGTATATAQMVILNVATSVSVRLHQGQLWKSMATSE
jgi:hypothetical protein